MESIDKFMQLFKRSSSLFVLILFSSVIYRVTNLPLIEFKSDEAINLYLAARPLFGYSFAPGATTSSLGVLNPPLLIYLLFPLTLISLDPKIISGMIGVINAVAIGLFFLILSKYFSKQIAFVSALLLAFSPWQIIFSRKIWAQNLLLPFLVLQLFSIFKIVNEKKQIYWLLLVSSGLFLIQIHLATLFFVAIITTPLLFKITKKSLPYIGLGLCLGILPLVPYIFYEMKHGCPDCTALGSVSEKAQQESFVSFIEKPIQIMGTSGFYKLFGDDYLTFRQTFPLAYQTRIVFGSLFLLIPLSMVIFWRKYPQFRFFVIPPLTIPIMYYFFSLDNQIHYYISLMPCLALFLGVGFVFFLSKKLIILKSISIVVFLGILLSSIYFISSFFHFLSYHQSLSGEYGTIYEKHELLIRRKFEKYKNDRNYYEMFLSSFIPYSFAYADIPFSKMNYSPHLSKDALKSIENRLLKVPEDPQAQKQLIAYYSYPLITQETLYIVRQKMKENPSLQTVYRQLYERYLAGSFQKSIIHPSTNIVFEFPEHWQEDVTSDTITFIHDDLMMVVTSASHPNLNSYSPKDLVAFINTQAQVYECIDDEIWCGTTIEPVLVGDMSLSVTLISNTNKMINDESVISAKGVFKRMLQSAHAGTNT